MSKKKKNQILRNIKGENYLLTTIEKDFLTARNTAREIHGVFNKKVFIPNSMSFNQVRKKSMVKARIKKLNNEKYGIYTRPKKIFMMPHPVIMENKNGWW